jgi:putative aldouronate transport system substrate-binding protein
VLAQVPKETIAEHAPHIYAEMNATRKVGWNFGLYQGKHYGYSTAYPTGIYSSVTEWRSDLLRKVGITDTPDTIEEFEAAFAELRKAGLAGMTTSGPSYYAQFMTIFGAYGVMPMAWQLKDGKVVNGAVSPTAKDALSLLQKWYKKGYIDTEFMSNQSGAQQQKFTSGKVAMWDYGAVFDNELNNPNSLIVAARKSSGKAEISFGNPPQGPGGRGSWSWGPGGWTVAFGKQLQNDPAKLQQILKIADRIDSDDTLGTKLAVGQEGVTYKLADPAKGLAGGWSWIGDYVNPQVQQANGVGGTPPAVGQPSWKVEVAAAYPDPKQLQLAKQYGKYGVYDLFGKAGVIPGSDQYLANLQNLKIRAYAAIVTGQQPVSSFDDFVSQWNTAGGKQLTAAANEFYQQSH